MTPARGQVVGSHVQFNSMSKIARLSSSEKTTGAVRTAAAAAASVPARQPASINSDRKNAASLAHRPSVLSASRLERKPREQTVASQGRAGCMNGTSNGHTAVSVSRTSTSMQAGRQRTGVNVGVSREKTRTVTSMSGTGRDGGLVRVDGMRVSCGNVDGTRGCWGLDELNEDDHPQVRTDDIVFCVKTGTASN